jgi:hypothetical protein
MKVFFLKRKHPFIFYRNSSGPLHPGKELKWDKCRGTLVPHLAPPP